MNVIWTEGAEADFRNILLYLSSEFSEREAEKFYDDSFKVLDQIIIDPFLFGKTEIQSVRKAVIHKFTTLFYTVDAEKEAIVLLFFFDTRQNPNKIYFKP